MCVFNVTVLLGKRKQTTEGGDDAQTNQENYDRREKRVFKDVEEAAHYKRNFEASKTAKYVLKKCPKDFGRTGRYL